MVFAIGDGVMNLSPRNGEREFGGCVHSGILHVVFSVR